MLVVSFGLDVWIMKEKCNIKEKWCQFSIYLYVCVRYLFAARKEKSYFYFVLVSFSYMLCYGGLYAVLWWYVSTNCYWFHFYKNRHIHFQRYACNSHTYTTFSVFGLITSIVTKYFLVFLSINNNNEIRILYLFYIMYYVFMVVPVSC